MIRAGRPRPVSCQSEFNLNCGSVLASAMLTTVIGE